MNHNHLENKLLNTFNRNISTSERYTDEDINEAFSKENYSSASDKEKFLFERFFIECANNDDVTELIQNYNTSATKLKKIYSSYETHKKLEFGRFWEKRFRIKKEASIFTIQSRDNDIYKEIDNFETYELTPCIAYEMAIRNDDVKTLLKRYDKITAMMDDPEYQYKRYLGKDDFETSKNNPLYGLPKEYQNLSYEEYEEVVAKKFDIYEEFIEGNYKKFIDEYIDRSNELGMSHLDKLKKRIEDELINNYLIYPTGYIRDVPGATYFYKEEITNSKKDENKTIIGNEHMKDGMFIRFEEIIHDEFIQVQGTNIKNTEYYVNNIIPNFHRQVNDQNQINIPINFSLPLEEIIEYITKVKKKINPKTPLELLGEKLDKANDMSNIKVGKETLDATRGEESQKKFADMFFIYDMRQQGFANGDIEMELNYSNDDKHTGISTNTIEKYYKIAKDYIDKERYKELITGKSSKN